MQVALAMLLLRLLLLPSICVHVVNASNPTSCLTSVHPEVDYFPTKVSPVDSEWWSITYHNTYKVLTNKDTLTTYALYQCGTEAPTGASSTDNYTAVIEIPLTSVGVMTTPMITMLEQIGQLDAVRYFLTDPKYISSPCFLERVEDGEVVVPTALDEIPGSSSTPFLPNNATLNDTVAFGNPWDVPTFFQTIVSVSEYREVTNAAIFEWVKYYAAFFNAEELANAVVSAAAAEWDCVSSQAAATATDAARPNVLWAYYSEYCLGWAVGGCPNYYCEYAEACGAALLQPRTNGSVFTPDCGDVPYLSTEEFLDVAKDAEYWIFPASYWNRTYAEFSETLDGLASVQRRQVYDFQGSGEDAWFQERYAQYYEVLQDFCHVVGTHAGLVRGDHWFRNVFTEVVGSPGLCEGENSTTITPALPFVFGGCDNDSSAHTKSGSLTGTRRHWATILAAAILSTAAAQFL